MTTVDRISNQNSHWGQISPFATYPFKRDLFVKIWSDITIRPMIFLTGPRRVGKSVLIKQIINQLSETGTPSTQILFFEFSPFDTTDTLWEVFDFFSKKVADNNKKRYVFLDELQFVPNYEGVIKEIYDNHEQIKIAVTGSLSLSYKKRMQESLAGRFLSYRLFPLNFGEYLHIKNSPLLPIFQNINHPSAAVRRIQLESLNAEFRHFLPHGRLPETIKFTPDQASLYLKSVIGQSLTQDAFSYFQIQKPQIITAIFSYLRLNNGAAISVQNLSQETGSNRETVAKYLDILEIMGLVYPVNNSLNPLTKLNSIRKFYVSSCFALLDPKYNWDTALGFAAESYVLERLLEKDETVTFFHKRQKEIDFLLPRKKIAYEVKYRSSFLVPKPLPGYETKILSLENDSPVCMF